MAILTKADHGIADEALIRAADLARLLGVSKPAVTQAVKSGDGRLDVFLNSKGETRFHPQLSVAQWSERRVSRQVSTPTRGQRAAGLDNYGAQAVAHLPLAAPAGAATPPPSRHGSVPAPGGEERGKELAMSRAQKEGFAARLLEIKVRKEEGSLVDRSLFYQKAYTITKVIQDQLSGIPPQLGPAVVSAVEEGLVAAGLTPEQARAATDRGNLQHVVREGLRLGILRSLRSLTEKPVEELLS